MAKKFRVKKDTCIGCGVCAGVAGAVFALASDGLAENVLGEEVPDDLVAAAEEAKSSCPVQAIEEE